MKLFPARLDGGHLGAQVSKDTLVLVIPPERGLVEGFSSGVVALANYVRAHAPAIDVRLLDLGLADALAEQEIARTTKDASGRLFVGITTTTASYQSALRVARAFKKLNSSCVVILGGHHASAQDQVILCKHGYIDVVVRGEGEIPLLTLVTKYPNMSDVPSISYRDQGSIQISPPGRTLTSRDLDSLPPNFDGLGIRSAPGKIGHLTYVSARGCPLRCSFCAVANDPIRAKSVDAIVGDLRYLVGHLGYKSIAFEDNFFAHSPKRTLAVCNGLERLQTELTFTWDCQTRVESMHRPELVGAMRRAGCDGVYLGVEALAAEPLMYLGKTTRPDTYLRILEDVVLPLVLNSGMECFFLLQVGLPNESKDTRDQTIRRLERLGKAALAIKKSILIFPHLHVIYPGTRHYVEAHRSDVFGPLGDNVFEWFTDWEARREPVLNWMGHTFGHGVGGVPIGILCREKLRDNGEFEVNATAVLEISTYLQRMEAVPGIKVFNYGPLLVGSSRENQENSILEEGKQAAE